MGNTLECDARLLHWHLHLSGDCVLQGFDCTQHTAVDAPYRTGLEGANFFLKRSHNLTDDGIRRVFWRCGCGQAMEERGASQVLSTCGCEWAEGWGALHNLLNLDADAVSYRCHELFVI